VFTATCSERKLVTGPTLSEKAKSFYDEMTKIDNCTFSEGWLQNFKEQAAKEISKWNTPLLVVQPKYSSSNKELPVRT
jgi:hypothetical protein